MKISRRNFIAASAIGGLSLLAYKAMSLFGRQSMAASQNLLSENDQLIKLKNNPRIVSIHSPGATYWDYKSYPYVDSIDQTVVEKMLNKGVMELTSEDSLTAAWNSLFINYRRGDIVAIKPNFNDLYKDFKQNLVASPAVINAIVKGLVGSLSIPPSNIIIYDCSRIIPDIFRERIQYPVKYVEPYGSSFWRKIRYKTTGNPLPKANLDYEIKMSRPVSDENGKQIKCYLPNIITRAQHIINVPILKSHQFVLASGALKNHYGTVQLSDGHHLRYLHHPIIHESIADLNNHPLIKENTRLVVMDSLFGRLKKKGGSPDKWITFGNTDPNRLFLSQDPVALDTVTSTLVRRELEQRGEDFFSDDFLRIASKKGIGIFETPDSQGNFSSLDYRQFEI